MNTIFLQMEVCLILEAQLTRSLLSQEFQSQQRSLRVTEAACTSCTQTGSGWSHLAIAVHLHSWDAETSVSPRMLCQATDPWPQGCVKGSIHSAGFYTPSLLMGGPGDTGCHVWEESALRICPSAGTLPEFPTTRVTPLWLKAVVPYHFPPLAQRTLFNIKTFYRFAT